MMKIKLLRLTHDEHWLALAIHRLAADCLSVSQLLRDLWATYEECLHDRPSTSLPDTVSYRDYALWQHTMHSDWMQKHAPWWSDYLARAKCVKWPSNRSEPHSAQVTATLAYCFDEPTSAGLRDLGRRTHTLPSLVILSLYAVTLSRWCGQQDFVLPFNVAGRHSEHDSVVGYFSQVLYLRITLTGQESFLDSIKRVSNEFYRATFHQDYGRIALQTPGFLSGTLCQWLGWHPADAAGNELHDLTRAVGITIESLRLQPPEDLTNLPPGVTDVEISFFEQAGQICLQAIYRADRISVHAMESFVAALHSTAQQFIRSSSAPVTALPPASDN